MLQPRREVGRSRVPIPAPRSREGARCRGGGTRPAAVRRAAPGRAVPLDDPNVARRSARGSARPARRTACCRKAVFCSSRPRHRRELLRPRARVDGEQESRSSGRAGRSVTSVGKLSGARRKDALQRDAEVEREVGLQVVVRQAAAGRCELASASWHELSLHGPDSRVNRRERASETLGPGVHPRAAATASTTRGCGRGSPFEQRHRVRAAGLAQVVQRKPGPCPGCIGAGPWRLGSAKVDCRSRRRSCRAARRAPCSARSA